MEENRRMQQTSEKESQLRGKTYLPPYRDNKTESPLFYIIAQPMRFSLNENSASIVAVVENFSARENIEKVLKMPCEIRISPFYSNASTILLGRVRSLNTKNLKGKGRVCYVITINFDYKDNEARRINFIVSRFLPPHGVPGGSRDYGLKKAKLEFFPVKTERKKKDQKNKKS